MDLLGEPRDRCPYRRPYAAGFDECPTYQPQLFVPLTSSNLVLPAIRSCSFLSFAELTEGQFYAQCRLGSADDRMAWLAGMDADRLAVIKQMRQALSLAVRGAADRLWELKGEQLTAQAGADLEQERQATLRLDEQVAILEQQIERFLEEQSAALDRLGIARADLRALTRALLDDMVVRRGSAPGPIAVSDAVLDRFPPEVRAIFRPYESSRNQRSD
jgi:hypothetical protein